tara:strand:+ start:1599 stop:1826 length:228 start_codon:yes stop_codon:yes gene_type:complete
MEAKDARLPEGPGSFGFDFEGIYDEIIDHEKITYAIADGRQVTILLLAGVAMSKKAYLRKVPKLNYEQDNFDWED